MWGQVVVVPPTAVIHVRVSGTPLPLPPWRQRNILAIKQLVRSARTRFRYSSSNILDLRG